MTCILSLTIATAPSISSHLQGPFLCPVLAVSVCSTSIGASLDIGWQTIKGTFYAAIFGFILFCTTDSTAVAESTQEDRAMQIGNQLTCV